MATIRITGLEGRAQGVVVHADVTATSIESARASIWKEPTAGAAGDLAYAGRKPVTMTFELIFDGVEAGKPVQADIADLQEFTEVDTILKRPPKIEVTYGNPQKPGIVPPFEAVIDTCTVRYLVFDQDGAVLKAIVSLACREATNVTVARARP